LQDAALVAIDKLDRAGGQGVEEELLKKGVDRVAARACLDFFAGSRTDALPAAALRRLGDFLDSNEIGRRAVEELGAIVDLAERTPAGARIRVDPSLARGLSYYTGAIMEVAVPDLAGSLGGGGRYDNLVGMFLGRDVPACGFSLGLERIIVVMTERGMFPPKVAEGSVDVMVAFLTDDMRGDALTLAAELRGEKLRVEIYPESSRRLEKPLKYAADRHVAVLAILGEDERARGEVAVRDLHARRQESIPRSAAAAEIRRRLESHARVS
jgi:histidyl-tRNA synthetase